MRRRFTIVHLAVVTQLEAPHAIRRIPRAVDTSSCGVPLGHDYSWSERNRRMRSTP